MSRLHRGRKQLRSKLKDVAAEHGIVTEAAQNKTAQNKMAQNKLTEAKG